jgi:hypothetical protein
MTRMTCPDKGASFSRTILKDLRLGRTPVPSSFARDRPPPALSPESKNFRPPGCRTSKLPAFILPIGIRTVKALATFGLQHGRVRRTVAQSGLAFPSATELQFDRFQPGGWTNSNSAGPGSAQPGSAVLNSVGLPATYSTQSSRIIRCTSSALKPIPSGCLLPS